MPQSTDLELYPLPSRNGEGVRVLMVDGEPHFVAVDVTIAMGYGHSPSALRSIPEDEKGVRSVHTLGGVQKLTCLTEAGLYRLMMRSDRPEAAKFQWWITHEVLPQIRKTGAYGTPREEAPLSELEVAERYVAALRRNRELEGTLEEQALALEAAQPALEKHDAFMAARGLFQVAEVAQGLGTGQRRLYAFLRRHGVLISTAGTRWNHPKQEHVEAGRFELVPADYESPRTGEPRVSWVTHVTPKGVGYIHDLITKHGRDGL